MQFVGKTFFFFFALKSIYLIFVTNRFTVHRNLSVFFFLNGKREVVDQLASTNIIFLFKSKTFKIDSENLWVAAICG